MMDFLDKIIFNNTVGDYLIELTIILAALLGRNFVSKIIANLLFIPLQKHWSKLFKEEFIALTIKPLSWFMVTIIIVFSIEKLNYPSTWNFKIHGFSLLDILNKIGTIAIIATFFYFLQTLINFIALLLKQNNNEADKTQSQVIIFFKDLLKIFIIIVAILCIIKYAFNQNIGSLLTGLSIVGAALALAAKESIENLIASFIIFFDKPFFIGDLVKVHNIIGTVEYVGLRSTRLRTLEKTLVTMPNKQMVDAALDNWSMRTKRIAEIKLTVSEKSKPTEVKNLTEEIKQYLQTQTGIIESNVFFTDFSKDGAVIVVEYFTLPFSIEEFYQLKHEINLQLMQIMEDHKIEMLSSGINIINNDTSKNIAAL